MQIKKLKMLIKQGESDTLEFKKTTAELPAAMKTLCAYLNSESGGTILIGVTNEDKITGQTVSDSTRKTLASELSKISPHADIDIHYVPIINGDKRYVIALSTRHGKKAPYVCDGRPYMRSQSTTIKMPQEEYELLLINRRTTISWETLTTNDCSLNDLDKKLIRDVIRNGISAGRITDVAERASIGEILKKLELIEDNKLTNAAVILFCKKEQKQFTQAEIKLARFLGLDKSEFLDSKMYRDNAFVLLEKAMTFLNFHLPIAARIEEGKLQRVETPAIPFKVLREALVNALCHRDYSSRSGSIDIAIYDDRVEISNAGRLTSEIKLSELTKTHRSYPRNKLIANIFYLCQMIERWGRGTLDMINLCKQAGNPIPRFEESTGSFSVILPLKESMRQFTRVQTRLQTMYDRLTNRQKEIVTILKQGPASRENIMAKIKTPIPSRTLQLELSRLKKLGLITQEGKGSLIVWALL